MWTDSYLQEGGVSWIQFGVALNLENKQTNKQKKKVEVELHQESCSIKKLDGE